MQVGRCTAQSKSPTLASPADEIQGVGWIIWRDESFLPKHLIFELHYLGGTEESYTLNFSRPGAQIIAQYYNLIHLGFDGFRAIMENCLSNARLLSKSLEATGWCKHFRHSNITV